MKKVFWSFLILVVFLLSKDLFAQTGTFSGLNQDQIRATAMEYLEDDLADETLYDLVECCISKFNLGDGKIQKSDALLIEGGILAYYKKAHKIKNTNQVYLVDLAMMRFALGGISKKALNITRDQLMDECIDKIRWDGVKSEQASFYFDDGFLKLLIRKVNELRLSTSQKNEQKLEVLELELLALILQLWDSNLEAKYLKELIDISNTLLPEDLSKEISISKMIRVLPAGKYPRDYEALLSATIQYILLNYEPQQEQTLENEKITDFLVNNGFVYSLSSSSSREVISANSMLLDYVNPNKIEQTPNKLMFLDYKRKIDGNYLKVKMSNILNTEFQEIDKLLEIFAVEVTKNELKLTEKQAELLSEVNFYELAIGEIYNIQDATRRSEAETMLFCIMCVVDWNRDTQNIILGRDTIRYIAIGIHNYINNYGVIGVPKILSKKNIPTVINTRCVNNAVKKYSTLEAIIKK